MHWKITVLGRWIFLASYIQLSPHSPTLYHWILFNVGNQQNFFVERWGGNEGSHTNEKWEWSEVSFSEKRKSSSARNHGNYVPNSLYNKAFYCSDIVNLLYSYVRNVCGIGVYLSEKNPLQIKGTSSWFDYLFVKPQSQTLVVRN